MQPSFGIIASKTNTPPHITKGRYDGHLGAGEKKGGGQKIRVRHARCVLSSRFMHH